MNTKLLPLYSIIFFSIIQISGLAIAAPAKETGITNKLEKAVLDELSLARTKPKEYARFLEDFRSRFKDNSIVVVDGKNIRTQEGPAAVDEAIAFLKKAKPVSPLTGSRALSLAAKDHVLDTGPKGITGHTGTDKSQFGDRIARHGRPKSTSGENISYGPNEGRAIVMQLIIDDGVANRGHRTNIFNPDFKTVGISIGEHKTYGYMCVMDFADHVTEKK